MNSSKLKVKVASNIVSFLCLIACENANAEPPKNKCTRAGERCIQSRYGGRDYPRWVEPFVLADTFRFAGEPTLPPCTGDSRCVFQCKVKSDFSSGACYDNTGAEMSTYTEGVSAQFSPSYLNGVYAWTGLDDTLNANRTPRLNNAAVRSMFGGDHTVVALGYVTSVVNPSQWMAMIPSDGTNAFQMRRGSGNLECVEVGSGGSAISSAPLSLDGYSMFSCRKSGSNLIARATEQDGSSVTSSIAGFSSGSLSLWGGQGGCCAPQGSAHGQLVSITGYNDDISSTELALWNKRAFGAGAVMNGANGAAGTVATVIIGRESFDGGYVFPFRESSYIQDPSRGIHAQKGFQNLWATDPLAAATWRAVGTPTITSNASAGPFVLWKNTNECDLVVDDDGAAFEGVGSNGAAFPGLDGAAGKWVNVSAYLKAGTSGTTTDKARIRINHNGSVVAGSDTCDITGLTSTAQRLPAPDGCWAWIDNATSITADLLVGNTTGTTGSITVCQAQTTNTMYTDQPTYNGTNRGSTWPTLDAGSMPYGSTKGKIEAVFQIPYSTSNYTNGMANDQLQGTYVFDSSSYAASHDVLTWVSADTQQPDLEALMYGPGATDENRFRVKPYNLTGHTWYVWSYEWRPEAGGCRALTRFDACSNPATCTAATVVASNTGALGECPLQPNIIEIGTRIAGSDPTSIWMHTLRVYQ